MNGWDGMGIFGFGGYPVFVCGFGVWVWIRDYGWRVGDWESENGE